ncbi:hypothetical protein EZV62_017088 [Acer yangbiense]|uniref:F-box domain-containing protein n=1 Tax=Acer yangbiense TaxID=1000413 RepID=A0A5C7HGG1_9ROSI|nr:hypothetical protein EZV62_017088 [Acer yangbiense]
MAEMAMDRLSNLPDTIIHEILSQLPTREAVKTCVLSKTWKYHWTHTHALILHLDCNFAHSNPEYLENFVLHVLRRHHPLLVNLIISHLRCNVDMFEISTPRLKSFELSSDHYYSSSPLAGLNMENCPILEEPRAIIRFTNAFDREIKLEEQHKQQNFLLMIRQLKFLDINQLNESKVKNIPEIIDNSEEIEFEFGGIVLPKLLKYETLKTLTLKGPCSFRILSSLSLGFKSLTNLKLSGTSIEYGYHRKKKDLRICDLFSDTVQLRLENCSEEVNIYALCGDKDVTGIDDTFWI